MTWDEHPHKPTVRLIAVIAVLIILCAAVLILVLNR
jgi:hypothetical protein